MQIVIDGVAPHVNGSYDLDWTGLTNRELNEVKRISGVRPAEMLDALVASDAAFACALAIIAARRDGKLIPEDVILDSTGGNIKFVLTDDGAAGGDVPPTKPKRSKGQSSRNSGSASKKSSASPAADPSRIGEPT
jgi:hypothetical protein